jgi:predicted SprT family Zn-dependent metalloprotease
VVSDRQLKHWYDKYNKLWFNNDLPSHTVLFWEPLPKDAGNTCPVYEVDHGQFLIKIDPSLKGVPCYFKITLLHEMTHLKLWPKYPRSKHGKVFQNEMQRLANDGAFKQLW